MFHALELWFRIAASILHPLLELQLTKPPSSWVGMGFLLHLWWSSLFGRLAIWSWLQHLLPSLKSCLPFVYSLSPDAWLFFLEAISQACFWLFLQKQFWKQYLTCCIGRGGYPLWTPDLFLLSHRVFPVTQIKGSLPAQSLSSILDGRVPSWVSFLLAFRTLGCTASFLLVPLVSSASLVLSILSRLRGVFLFCVEFP